MGFDVSYNRGLKDTFTKEMFVCDTFQIIGAKNKPGETIDSTDKKDVNKALDEVTKAAGITSRR